MHSSGLEAFNWVALGNLVRGSSIIVFVTAGAALGGVSGALFGYIAVGAAYALLSTRHPAEVRFGSDHHFVSLHPERPAHAFAIHPPGAGDGVLLPPAGLVE